MDDTESKDFAAKDKGSPPSATTSPRDDASHPHANYQRLVTPDPAAFRYLEEDPSTTVLERRRRLQGYELYFVEQWGCSRVHPTYTITTYTGLEQHSIVVGVLSIPTDETAWSPRLRVYLKAIAKYHARRRETPLGTLMVTNLSGFPSALTVVAVPDGDLRMHREAFIVNENLKRLGCSGRAGLNLSPPSAATQTKFVQSYRTSDQIPIGAAVIELVKLCQVALMFFDKLAPEYADGLLCDVTETAINEWWSDVGSDIFNADPNDGILGPSTVAALLGLLMGARNRLGAYGAPVSKDVFDLPATKRAIAYFQKSQKMGRTRRLDKDTLNRLHKVTAKAASGGEGWTVPRAVKSTVAELSGKGGELVNGREKARIAEVESVNIETFVHLAHGERFKWLWRGKPRKNGDSDVFGSIFNIEGWDFDDTQEGGYRWISKRRSSVDDDQSLRHNFSEHFYLNHLHGSHTSMDHMDKDPVLRKAVLKNVTGRVTDTRSGLGRIKSAVGRRGLRSHRSKVSGDEVFVEDGDETPAIERSEFLMPFEIPDVSPEHSRRPSTVDSVDAPSSKNPDQPNGRGTDNSTASYSNSVESLETPMVDPMSNEPRSDYMELIDHASGINARDREHEDMETIQKRSQLMNDTTAIKKMAHFDWESTQVTPLRSTRSLSYLDGTRTNVLWQRRWPRQMSFTAVVDVLSGGQPPPITPSEEELMSSNADAALAFEQSFASQNRVKEARLQRLKAIEVPWMEAKIAQIEAYDQQCGRDQAKLDLVFHHKTEESHELIEASDELLQQERSALMEAGKELETLGAKLEYELSALQSRVEDAEDGMEDFERQVGLVETRVKEQLLGEGGNGEKSRKSGWFWWLPM